MEPQEHFTFSEVACSLTSNNLQILGFIFFFAGMAFKISIVPFHLWTADVYEGSPVNITSYLSVISKGAAVFILIIILFTVFPCYNCNLAEDNLCHFSSYNDNW